MDDSLLLLLKLNMWVIATIAGIAVFFIFLSRFTQYAFKRYIKKIGKKSMLSFIYDNIKWMIPLFYILIFLAVTTHALRISTGIDLNATMKKSVFHHYLPMITPLFESMVLAWFAIFIIRTINGVKAYLTYLSRTDESASMDIETVHLICRSLQVLVLLFVGIGIIGVFGQDVSSLLAVSGVGTVVLGFAAQSTLANLFGGLYLLTDRPFVEGQWIRSPDRKIEGVVEVVGWRITKVRTFEKTILYIPNSVFSTVLVENVSRMSHRRIQEVLTIRYNDAIKMKQLVSDIREYIDQVDDIDHNMFKTVNFDAMADSSLNIKITCFSSECATALFRAVKEKILFDLIDIVHKNGCDFAYPTQTIHIPEIEKSN